MARIFPTMLIATLAGAGAGPALAHDHEANMPQGTYQGAYPETYQGGYQGGVPMPYGGWPPASAYAPQQRAAPYPQQDDPRYSDMVERCRRYAKPDNGVGGAVIGGVVGGVIGNRVASGNRTLGTVAGAAIGALTGRAIDKSEDKGRERECAEFFRSYAPAAPYGQGYPGAYGAPGYGYMMVPVYMVPGPQRPYTETTTTTVHYVTETRRRCAPRRPVYRHQRVKEKRVYVGS